MSVSTVNPYLRDAVMTATPEQLQLMLYDGAIRFALQGRDAITRKDHEAAYEKLTRAQHIVLEMLNGLNYEVNPELCKRVASIYNFLYRKLVDACVKRDVNEIDDALKVLRIERETWQMLVDKVNRVRDGAEPAHDTPPPSANSESFLRPSQLPGQPRAECDAAAPGARPCHPEAGSVAGSTFTAQV